MTAVTIEQARLAKEAAERDIMGFLVGRLSQLQMATGLSVEMVSVQFMVVDYLGGRKSHVLQNVQIKMEEI